MVSRIERLRNLFLYVFFLLVISIIFTPLLVDRGFALFSAEILESIFLLAQVSIAWQVFRLYERSIRYREREIAKLEKEYQRREKELLEAFAYLGKVNVQVSLIKSFLQKLKAPSNLKEAENYINEILKIVLSLSGREWATLRAIDMKSLQTLKEYWVYSPGINPEDEVSGIKIGNKGLIRSESGRVVKDKKDFYVFGSSGSGLQSTKVFLIFRNEKKLDPDIMDFIRAAANQCEVLLTLFDMREKN